MLTSQVADEEKNGKLFVHIARDIMISSFTTGPKSAAPRHSETRHAVWEESFDGIELLRHGSMIKAQDQVPCVIQYELEWIDQMSFWMEFKVENGT